ncbi:MAG: phosphate signaling complex protein PhoU [Theionarchaea archaeon]|nr:phosphate signaling complex protein PhoU [Theionarchaea archaeon]MBU7022147.1 phosphate signaling complex protein PhoU [Theionarchaea archaeon]MBU7040184.1 phosphate signaling complex protein PhoU [Theionarchaea archaeon]
MVERFHVKLDDMKEEVLKMGFLAEEMLEKSVIALKDQDPELAEEIISKKEKIAALDFNIEKDVLRLVPLYQPMAKDMRTIACILKMITYLTRIGRYGKDIAKVVPELIQEAPLCKLVNIPYMAEIVGSMIHDALKAFETEDLTLIADFDERDDKVDALRYSIFRECISYMTENPRNITQCAHYIMIARYLERCADHACKIAEKIHYMVTGEHIEIG